MLVYKDGGPHKRQGGTYSYMAVTEDTLEAALKDGWKKSLIEIIDPPKKAVKKDAKLDKTTDSE